MASAAAEGAGPSGYSIAAQAAMPDDVMRAAGYLFVCPENLGSMSGTMKEFFDRAYYPLLGKIEGKPYATAIAAGSNGYGAEVQIDRIVTGWRLRRVAPSLIVNLGAQTAEAIQAEKVLTADQFNECRELGAVLSQGLQLGIF